MTALLAGAFSALFIYRVVRRPVAELIRGTQRVAGGDLDHARECLAAAMEIVAREDRAQSVAIALVHYASIAHAEGDFERAIRLHAAAAAATVMAMTPIAGVGEPQIRRSAWARSRGQWTARMPSEDSVAARLRPTIDRGSTTTTGGTG